MNALYSLGAGFDRWLTTDPADDGSHEAIEQIECELSDDEDEVRDALSYVDEDVLDAIAAAFVKGGEARASVWEVIDEKLWARLEQRAIEVFNQRQEDARLGRDR